MPRSVEQVKKDLAFVRQEIASHEKYLGLLASELETAYAADRKTELHDFVSGKITPITSRDFYEYRTHKRYVTWQLSQACISMTTNREGKVHLVGICFKPASNNRGVQPEDPALVTRGKQDALYQYRLETPVAWADFTEQMISTCLANAIREWIADECQWRNY